MDVRIALLRVGFHHFIDIPPCGLKGGFVFAWRPGFDFEVTLLISLHIVNMFVFSDPNHTPCHSSIVTPQTSKAR